MNLITLILLVTTAIASQVHLLRDHDGRAMLLDRNIDPSTMNPAQLALLQVLKTAMPAGPDAPLPTGDSDPEWYKNLPENVKSLLFQFYPATSTSSSSSSSSTASAIVQATPTAIPSSSQASESMASTSMPTITSVSSSMAISLSSSPFSNSAMATAPPLSSVSGHPSPTRNHSTTLAAPPHASATPSMPVSTGLANTLHKSLLATAVAWASVAAGFCLLA